MVRQLSTKFAAVRWRTPKRLMAATPISRGRYGVSSRAGRQCARRTPFTRSTPSLDFRLLVARTNCVSDPFRQCSVLMAVQTSLTLTALLAAAPS